jgi:CDP-diacylglycerol--serine O-phosphatidyltransferase
MAIIAKLRERRQGRPGRERRLRAVQTLPTLCTLGNLICGFGALHLCLRAMVLAGAQQNPAEVHTLHSAVMERMLPSHLVMAAYLVFAAMIFDALDGRLARLTRHTTDFGAQLDSLADVVSFGVVPPLLMMALLTRQLAVPELLVAPLSPSFLGRLAWLAAATYAACAALRLARFNVENEPVELAHQKFRGLPSPGAAGALCSLIILHDSAFFYTRAGAKAMDQQGGLVSTWILWTLPLAAVLFALLMVSRFHYPHLVNRFLRRRRSITDILRVFIVVGVVVLYREYAFAVILLLYAFSGPVAAWWRRMNGRGGSSSTPAAPPADGEAGGQAAVS